MIKKLLALSIIAALYLAVAFPASAASGSSTEKQTRFTEKVKDGIAKLGVGPDAQVQVKLRDKTKLTGYISEVNDESFVLVAKDGNRTVVAYPDITQVKGNNLSTRTKITIAAVIVGALAIIYFSVFAGKHL